MPSFPKDYSFEDHNKENINSKRKKCGNIQNPKVKTIKLKVNGYNSHANSFTTDSTCCNSTKEAKASIKTK